MTPKQFGYYFFGFNLLLSAVYMAFVTLPLLVAAFGANPAGGDRDTVIGSLVVFPISAAVCGLLAWFLLRRGYRLLPPEIAAMIKAHAAEHKTRSFRLS